MDNLRKQGQATAAKRAGKAAKEGKVSIKIKDNAVSICEVNAETDFVARNEDFAQFVEDISDLLIAHKPEDVEAAKKLSSEAFGGQTVEAKTLELVGKIGENIAMRRCKILTVDPESEGISAMYTATAKSESSPSFRSETRVHYRAMRLRNLEKTFPCR
jgi:elongation factor Ts